MGRKQFARPHGPKKRKKSGKDSRKFKKKSKQNSIEPQDVHVPNQSDSSRFRQLVDVKESESSSSESEAEVTPYQKLISGIPEAIVHDSSDSSEEEEKKLDAEVEAQNNADVETGSDEENGDVSAEGGEPDYLDDNYESEEDEDKVLTTDVFFSHFQNDLPEDFIESLSETKTWKKEEVKLPVLGNCFLNGPQNRGLVQTAESNLSKLHIKQTLLKQFPEVNVSCANSETMTPLQEDIFSIINGYQDLCYTDRTHENGEEVRIIYCLHALNHILKTRSRVVAHNSKIKSKHDDIPDEYRDQGLTRPKVLIVLPFRDSALKVVNILMRLLLPKEQSYTTNRKRFFSEYGLAEEGKKGRKPLDYEATFTGNTDEHFRIGLGVAKKSLKLFTDFYSSDVILASPLGLRTVIGSEGEEERDYDFLSSIEVLIFDQLDVILMQNWDHVLHLMKYMHLQPTQARKVNFSRVRMWSLNGWAKFYRQTLLFSSLVTPEINALYNKHCFNYSGKVVVPKSESVGCICHIITQLPQVFHRISPLSHSQQADARFEFFIKKVLSEHKHQLMAQTLIFIPSYFDFVCLRNYFKKEEMSFCQICEYSKDASIFRARNRFFRKKFHFMLYTERFHYYRRYRIRGVKHLIFYELPVNPHFYSEICNMLEDKKLADSGDYTCHVIYSNYDAQRLAAIVGTQRATRMLNSDKTTHMFITGEDG